MTTATAESPGTELDAASLSFVINLCSSTSPMALTHPTSPELKRYTFFVSRQRQDGRDRFRLHMGYFDSQAEAEQLLEVVRDVYPAAWAGPAPSQGAGRRGRAAPKQPTPFRGPETAAPAPAAKAAASAAPTAHAPVAQSGAEPVSSEALSLEQTMSEMRGVLARLDDEAPTVQAPTVQASTVQEPRFEAPRPEPPVVQPVRSVVPAAPPPVVPPAAMDPPRLKPVSQPRVAAARPAPRPELTSEQALSLLETSVPPTPAGDSEGESKVRMLTPEDTQTLREIKLDKANNAPPAFAVQLIWSVTPIDSAAMPHLAIFDAYTLYHVEGNRQGRKWYGLRLGFFTDPNSATQVANYVRGDYRSVAVVPVSTREKDGAGGGGQASPADSAINPPLKAVEQFSTNSETMTGFELVADDLAVQPRRELDVPKQVPIAKVAPKAAGKAGKPAGKPTGKRAVARKKPERALRVAPGAADVLESTLEILGASTLTMDDSKSLIVDDAADRRSPARKPQNNKFSKLLSRLGGG